jgi:hypothetical protein
MDFDLDEALAHRDHERQQLGQHVDQFLKWEPVQRRAQFSGALKDLVESSRRLERATYALIVLTVILAALTVVSIVRS